MSIDSDDPVSAHESECLSTNPQVVDIPKIAEWNTDSVSRATNCSGRRRRDPLRSLFFFPE